MKQVLQALHEFTVRYGQAFGAAWSMRAALDPPLRTADELSFLPAHLELIETPVSPTSRWTMRVIIAFFCVALLWATFGKLDIVAVAPGKTVVGSRTKIIQPLETAVVRRILVRDGQSVKAGDLLIELDATAAAAELDQASEGAFGRIIGSRSNSAQQRHWFRACPPARDRQDRKLPVHALWLP